jgi:hypothetical protein
VFSINQCKKHQHLFYWRSLQNKCSLLHCNSIIVLLNLSFRLSFVLLRRVFFSSQFFFSFSESCLNFWFLSLSFSATLLCLFFPFHLFLSHTLCRSFFYTHIYPYTHTLKYSRTHTQTHIQSYTHTSHSLSESCISITAIIRSSFFFLSLKNLLSLILSKRPTHPNSPPIFYTSKKLWKCN